MAGASLAVIAAFAPPLPACAQEQAAAELVAPAPPPEETPALPAELQAVRDIADAIPPAEEPAGTLLVDELAKPTPPTAVVVDIPPPDLPPVTVVIDVAPAQDPVAASLRQLLDAERPAVAALAQLSRKHRQALAEFYAARNDAPIWIEKGEPTRAARAVVAQLAQADEDGLDPAGYPVIPVSRDASPADLARAELALSASAFAYARDARGGRVDPTGLSKLLTPSLSLPSVPDVLAELSQASDAAAALAAYQPSHAGYTALRRQLALLRDSTSATSAHAAIPSGPVLRTGMRDERVGLLRERLGLPAQPGAPYDDELAEAVAHAQRASGLKATGQADAATLKALNGERRASGVTAADIITNMERWRWLPQDLGARHIQVNIPDYSLALVEGDRVIHTTRVIVGKPDTQTPIFSQEMRYVVVNPYWNIPPSIMRNEILPKMAQDPDYAAKHGYEVVRRNGSISVRQPPGERNALGFIKFLFPNQHSVYLHDTPSRRLFANERRAYSHGCVRVDQPFRLAEFVLGAQGYDEARMRAMIGKGERTITLKTPLPVHLTYFTLFVDEDGRLQRRDDIYGHEGRIRTALGITADGRRFANLR